MSIVNLGYSQGFLYNQVQIVDQTDTLWFNGQKYACIIEKIGEFEIRYKLVGSTEVRSINRNLVSKIDDNRNARRFVSIDPEKLKGKKYYISIIPIENKGRYNALIDTGTNQGIDILSYEGEKLAFNSELAVINWFIMQGWELYEIMNYPEAEGTGSKLIGSFFGVDFKDWEITKEYVMWKVYE